jgi:hypothetical protein
MSVTNGNGNGSGATNGHNQPPALPKSLRKIVNKSVAKAVAAEKAAQAEEAGAGTEWYKPLLAGPQKYRDPAIFSPDWRNSLPAEDPERPTAADVITTQDERYLETLRMMGELDNRDIY